MAEEPMLFEEEPLLDFEDKPSICEDDCCEEPEPGDSHSDSCSLSSHEFEFCDDEDPEGIIACLRNMRAVVRLRHKVVDICNFPVADGTYFVQGPEATLSQNYLFEKWLYDVDVLGDPDSFDGQCLGSPGIWVAFRESFSIGCVGGKLGISYIWSHIDADSNEEIFAGGTGLFDLPITVGSNLEFELTPVVTNTSHPSENPFISIVVKFIGKPCSSEDCPPGEGPVADFDFDNGDLACEAPDDGCDPIYRGCSYIVTNNSTPGHCAITDCFWADGWEGCDHPPIGIGRCGNHEQDFTGAVVDAAGCVSVQTTHLACCNCCPPQPGNVNVSLNGCQVHIEIDDSGQATCEGATIGYVVLGLGGTVIECAGHNGSVLGPGIYDFTVCSSEITIYAVDCMGCQTLVGTWEVDCGCRCCTGQLSGLRITVSGLHNGTEGVCPCESKNGVYDIPNVGNCSGELVIRLDGTCTGDPEGQPHSVTLSWSIRCDDGDGYWLSLYASFYDCNVSGEIHLGATKPNCSAISRTVTFENPEAENGCDCTSITLSIEAYSDC